MQDEVALLKRARQFDTDALAQIHDTYYGPLFRYITFRISDRDVAEDLTSEVFTRFLSALRQRNPPETTLRGWLYGVAANVVADHMRKRYRAPQVELDEGLISHADGPHELAEAAMTRSDLRQALTHLTEEQQHVIALRFGRELPIQEVARAIGKTEGAVKQLQARAIAALARKLMPGTVE
ncbi:MAG: sigma-70 family RNA polymerase sigma factor [Chloroflexi bacterium SZAS-1]|nr:sigma-70 family RNA polymerase sigma factor [Chloroflexi bacterium SZAS-1]HNP84589.1 sigma-70 family RNA polymerase sigma factor [Kouleothrix sp.]